MDSGFRANPYPSYAGLRRNQPVVQVDPGGFWAVSRYDDVVHVLRHPRLFTSHGFQVAWEPAWLGYSPMAHSMLALDGEAHRRLRTLATRVFNGTAVRRLESRIRALAAQLADGLAAQGEADFISAFAMPLPTTVIGGLMGLEASLHGRFKGWADDLASITPEPLNAAHATRVRTTVEEMTRYLTEVLNARRREPAEDLVTDLVRAEVQGQPLTDREIIGFLVLVMVAGLETTVHLLGNALLFLAEHPDALARLRAEPMLIPRFIEELLRYESPVQCVLRFTTAETKLAGVTIPRDAVVMAVIGAANRDERRYFEPERFELHRELPSLAFGHGAHHCIGAMLARMEAQRGLEALLSRFQGFTRLSREVPWNLSFAVRGPASLPLRFIPAG
ncbi:cytochrome P450 [Stigmatella hybrida]|uniref:cytochrome P450 n=1 Tax=Stigmatella hybrida TaxID=394097 RepID=UPI001CDAF83D|nr:cytochrome P450 [Stigmatella hybrida]